MTTIVSTLTQKNQQTTVYRITLKHTNHHKTPTFRQSRHKHINTIMNPTNKHLKTTPTNNHLKHFHKPKPQLDQKNTLQRH